MCENDHQKHGSPTSDRPDRPAPMAKTVMTNFTQQILLFKSTSWNGGYKRHRAFDLQQNERPKNWFLDQIQLLYSASFYSEKFLQNLAASTKHLLGRSLKSSNFKPQTGLHRPKLKLKQASAQRELQFPCVMSEVICNPRKNQQKSFFFEFLKLMWQKALFTKYTTCFFTTNYLDVELEKVFDLRKKMAACKLTS